MGYKRFAGEILSDFDVEALTEAVVSQFDGKPRNINIDADLANKTLGFTRKEIIEASHDIERLIITHGKADACQVARSIYDNRNELLSFEYDVNERSKNRIEL